MPYDLQLIDGDLPAHPTHITGVELTAQRIRIRLQMHRGEWLLDRRVGVPYLRWRGQKPPRLQSIASRIRTTIQETPGVAGVRGLRAELVDRRVVVTGIILADETDEEIELVADLLEEGNVSPTIAMKLATSGTIL